MNILLLSTSHPYKTAGAMAGDLCRAFHNKGHNAKLLVKAYDSYSESFIVNYHNKLGYEKYRFLRKYRAKTTKAFGKQKNINPDYRVITANQKKSLLNVKRIKKRIGIRPDVIYIFFTQEFINFKDIYKLYKEFKVPIFINHPDMANFTGLCHYSWDCERFINNCGKCPAINSSEEKDISYQNLSIKKKYLKDIPVISLTVSNWLKNRLVKSSLFQGNEVIKIPSGTSRREFGPASDEKIYRLREKYGIKKDSFVISLAANNLSHKRKGIHHIISALNKIPQKVLEEKKVEIISIGRKGLPLELNHKKYKNLGFLGFNELAEFYQISDLFVSASIQDTGPGTIIESMLCGTPVVSYNTGVADEWVLTDKTGILVETGDIVELSSAIFSMISKSNCELDVIKNECVEFAASKNDFDNFYNKIEELFLQYSSESAI